MDKEWVLSVRNDCRKVGVPFFFKQWGGVRKALNGRELEGRTYDEFPASRVDDRHTLSNGASLPDSLCP